MPSSRDTDTSAEHYGLFLLGLAATFFFFLGMAMLAYPTQLGSLGSVGTLPGTLAGLSGTTGALLLGGTCGTIMLLAAVGGLFESAASRLATLIAGGIAAFMSIFVANWGLGVGFALAILFVLIQLGWHISSGGLSKTSRRSMRMPLFGECGKGANTYGTKPLAVGLFAFGLIIMVGILVWSVIPPGTALSTYGLWLVVVAAIFAVVAAITVALSTGYVWVAYTGGILAMIAAAVLLVDYYAYLSNVSVFAVVGAAIALGVGGLVAFIGAEEQ